jgi:hypothetical protein
LTKTATFEGGVLYTTSGGGGSGKFYVASLAGSWEEMGRQYGGLLAGQMADFYNVAVNGYFIGKQGATYDQVLAGAQAMYAMYTPELAQLIDGTAETSGLGADKQKIMAALMGMIFGCSSMDAWGAYSADGSMVTGRNWDTGSGKFDGFGGYLAAIVYKPNTAGAIPFVDVNYVGSLGMQNGMNAAGVFLDLQDGTMSDPGVFNQREPACFRLVDFLQQCSSLAAMDGPFSTTRPNLGLIINGSSANDARVYEWSASYDTKIRLGDGLLAASNHYIDPSWQNLPPIGDGAPYGYTKERLANLLAMAEKYKGKIDPTVMMQIFDTAIPNGGPSFLNMPDFETYYHIVAAPAQLTLWLKAPGWSGWEKMDLRSLLTH